MIRTERMKRGPCVFVCGRGSHLAASFVLVWHDVGKGTVMFEMMRLIGVAFAAAGLAAPAAAADRAFESGYREGFAGHIELVDMHAPSTAQLQFKRGFAWGKRDRQTNDADFRDFLRQTENELPNR